MAELRIVMICWLLAFIPACTTGSYEARIGRGRLRLELAITSAERAEGLMHRKVLAPDTGMLFVFPGSARRVFWMKNTSIPLSIAFLDKCLRVISIHKLKPFDRTPVGPRLPAMYALEVNRGWFRENLVYVGSSFFPGPELAGVLKKRGRD